MDGVRCSMLWLMVMDMAMNGGQGGIQQGWMMKIEMECRSMDFK